MSSAAVALVTDASRGEEKPQPIDEYDPEAPPETYLGLRVAVEWAGNRWYYGTITQYDEDKNQHFVLYDDNDKRWYQLAEKTFRFCGSDKIWYGKAPGTYQTFVRFIPYTPKDPNARTTVRFHLLLSPTFNLLDGDQVCIRGSLPQLGEWNASLPLVQDQDNPSVWTAEVVLPFEPNEACKTGIFEYKYAIESAPATGGLMQEGRYNRRVNVCRPHYYATFWPDKNAQRFKGYQKIENIEAFSAFVQTEFTGLMQGRFPAREFMTRLACINSGFYGVKRADAEATVTALIDRFGKDQIMQKPQAVLCLLAIVGMFGLSLKEKAAEAEPSWTSVAGGWATVGEKKGKKAIKAEPWCYLVIERSPVEAVAAMDVRAELGDHYQWAMAGLREAAERTMAEGSYRFLRIAPVLKSYSQLPSSSALEANPKAWKDRQESFLRVAEEVRALAKAAFELAAQELAARAAEEEKKKKEAEDAKAAATPTTGVTDAQKAPAEPKEPVSQTLGRNWLWSLVHFAPNIEILSELFLSKDVMREYALVCVCLLLATRQVCWCNRYKSGYGPPLPHCCQDVFPLV